MRLLLVAAGVAAAVRQTSAAECTLQSDKVHYRYTADDGTDTAVTDLTKDKFKMDFQDPPCKVGIKNTNAPTADCSTLAGNQVILTGCQKYTTSPLSSSELTRKNIIKKCTNTPLVPSPAVTPLLQGCWDRCQETVAANLADGDGFMSIAFKANEVCDCYKSSATQRKTCEQCGDTSYPSNTYFYSPTDHNYGLLPGTCVAKSTDTTTDTTDNTNSAASLPLAGATVAAAGVASLCV